MKSYLIESQPRRDTIDPDGSIRPGHDTGFRRSQNEYNCAQNESTFDKILRLARIKRILSECSPVAQAKSTRHLDGRSLVGKPARGAKFDNIRVLRFDESGRVV